MLREIYNNEYWRKVDTEDRSGKTLIRIKALGIRERSRILDYGCGSGKSTGCLQKAGYDACGHDITENFEYRKNVYNSIGKIKGIFDVIIAIEVLEHLTNPKQFFRNINKLVNKNSILFLTTTFYDVKQGKDFWYIAPRNGHISIFTKRFLLLLARAYGWIPIFSLSNSTHIFTRYKMCPLDKVDVMIKYIFSMLLQRFFKRLK